MNPSRARSASAAAALLTLLSCTGTEFDKSAASTTVNIETTAMQPSDLKADGTAKSNSIASNPNHLPLIDTEAPADFQTATFALG